MAWTKSDEAEKKWRPHLEASQSSGLSLRAYALREGLNVASVAVLAKGGTQKGHEWTYVADDEHVLFRFTPRRWSDGPREFLRATRDMSGRRGESLRPA